MKNIFYISTFLFLFVALFASTSSCQDKHEDLSQSDIDSLNYKAYKFHYISLDSVEVFAQNALQKAENIGYDDGIDEALCNIGFAKYMRLDYVPAQNTLLKVRDFTDNQLFRLVADVLMMRICQRRSENKDFFVYSNDAQDCIKRIEQDENQMNARQNAIWSYAVSEFHFANSVYNYYIRQDRKETDDLDFVKKNFSLVESDTAQEAMLYFLIGNSRVVDQVRPHENVKYLIEAASLAHNSNIRYILAKALSSISEDLSRQNNYSEEDIHYLKQHILNIDYEVNNDSLPLLIANYSLKEFNKYGSLFDISQTYIAIANYYISTQQGDSALSNMKRALECVNTHHRMVADDGIVLKPGFDPEYKDSLSIEKKWIRDEVVCLPEWMADVRERLSVVYALVGSKDDCFFNRNVYLDITEETRQDKIMTQVYNNLNNEQRELRKYLNWAFALLMVLVVAVYFMARRLRTSFTKKYIKEKKAVEEEMKRWREKTDDDFSNLEEKQELANAERVSKELRLEEHKRQYINKTTCLSIVYAITPFLDRAVNEVRKIKDDIIDSKNADLSDEERAKKGITQNNRLEYLKELIDRINLYNDILADWIKIRQGEVALNIEKFELQPLFDIMNKNNRMFVAKGIALNVDKTEAVVKADRALTLFMINTLLDNARKYSPEGGEVKLLAEEHDEYVDISVVDSGIGMSEDDVKIIMQEKIYDSSKIGDVKNDEELRKNKGFGFGLLNCKGIIEKYKKTSSVFSICKFGVESTLGKGSKFFFRLPKVGVKKLCLALLLSLSTSLTAFALTTSDNNLNQDSLRDSIPLDDLHERARNLPDHPAIKEAYRYAMMAYDSNVNEEWDDALVYVDSACMKLNEYYYAKEKNPKYSISLYDENKMADIDLWNSGFYTDYHTILDIRNEAAIAALAVNDYQLYCYNNEIFNRLYKLMNADSMLEQRCDETRQTIDNYKTLAIVLLVLVIMGVMIFLFVYYHNNIMPVFSLRQILELNRSIFNNEDENQLANIIHQEVDNIRRTDGVQVMIGNAQIKASDMCPNPEYLSPILKDSYKNKEKYILDNGKTRVYPLIIDDGTCIGAIAFLLHNENDNRGDDKLFSMIAEYTAVNIYYSSVRMERLNDDIELIEDDKRRTEREGNIVHVQNMVIDNTLSTIKHETMYYPNRIRQIVDKMADSLKNDNHELNEEYVNTMDELVSYYKEMFTILSDCAAKQIVRPMFKRKILDIEQVINMTKKLVSKYNKKNDAQIIIDIDNDNSDFRARNSVVSDETMLSYLIENVIDALINGNSEGNIKFDLDKSEDFIKFAFSFDHNSLDKKEMKVMFYPEALKYDAQNDKLYGAQMLLAKQIVREHDEHVRRGCRIFAQPLNENGKGLSIVFTIPANRMPAS